MGNFKPNLAHSIQGCLYEELCPFPRGYDSKIAKYSLRTLKTLLLHGHGANVEQSKHKTYLDEGMIGIFFQMKGRVLFQRGGNNEIVRNH